MNRTSAHALVRALWATMLAFGLSAVGCGGDSAVIPSGDAGDGGSNGSGMDSTVDTFRADTGVADTRPQDTGHPDSAVQDTGQTDTSTQDTGTPDAPADSAPADAPVDSSPIDAPADVPVDVPADAPIVCDAVVGNAYFVDPVNGADAPSSTGSDMAGGVMVGACAFKTIRYALSVVGMSTPTGTTVTVLGDVSHAINGETFPLDVPTNTIVQGAAAVAGGVTITVSPTVIPDGGTLVADGFHLNQPSSGLSSFTLQGTGMPGRGVVAGTGATASTTLDNITVMGFGADSGILVEGSGTLAVNAGTVSAMNAFGLRVMGTASAIVTGSNTAQTAFSQNSVGILVGEGGSIQLKGTPGTGGAGTVVANANTGAGGQDGVVFLPSTNTTRTLPPQSTLDGLVVWNSGASGIHIFGGAYVQVRNSYVLNNTQNGVLVTNNPDNCGGMTGCDDNYFVGVDLGTLPASPGLNTLQDTVTGAPNKAAGVCFLAGASTAGIVLYAQGNIYGMIDCSMTPAMLTRDFICAQGSNVDVGVGQNNTVYTTQCTN